MQEGSRKVLNAYNFEKEISTLRDLEGSVVLTYRPGRDISAYHIGVVKNYELDKSGPKMSFSLEPYLGYGKEPSDEELDKVMKFIEFSNKENMSWEPHQIEFPTENKREYIAVLTT